jgi:hypothetical protein
LLCVETLPPDEQPDALPVNPAALPAPLARRPDGTVADKATAKALGAKGGLAKAAKRAALAGVGMVKLADDHEYHAYWKACDEWLKFGRDEFAAACGGVMGPVPSAILGSAAHLLSLSRFFHAQAAEATDIKKKIEYGITASKFDDRFRQACLTAYELANKLGAQTNAPPVDPYAIIAKIAQQQIIDVVAEPVAED